MTTEATPGALGSNDQLGLVPERDEVLRQLDDDTNQTWRGKRKRWAALVRAQDAELERYKPLMQAVEWLLDDGHMNQEHLARLRAAFELAMMT
jgi:hypothetical protein